MRRCENIWTGSEAKTAVETYIGESCACRQRSCVQAETAIAWPLSSTPGDSGNFWRSRGPESLGVRQAPSVGVMRSMFPREPLPLSSDLSTRFSRCDRRRADSSSSGVKGGSGDLTDWVRRTENDSETATLISDDRTLDDRMLEDLMLDDLMLDDLRGSRVGTRESPTFLTSFSSSLCSGTSSTGSVETLPPKPLSTAASSFARKLFASTLRRSKLKRPTVVLLPLLLVMRLPMGEYWLTSLRLRQALPQLNDSSVALCSGATGRRYFRGGIFSPGWYQMLGSL